MNLMMAALACLSVCFMLDVLARVGDRCTYGLAPGGAPRRHTR